MDPCVITVVPAPPFAAVSTVIDSDCRRAPASLRDYVLLRGGGSADGEDLDVSGSLDIEATTGRCTATTCGVLARRRQPRSPLIREDSEVVELVHRVGGVGDVRERLKPPGPEVVQELLFPRPSTTASSWLKLFVGNGTVG